ncbi:MAG: ATP-dependent sacrificial sulfur transferase LarE [Bacteroidota bacterium]
MSQQLAHYISKLEDWFHPLEGSITAFSGGIDSTLVLFLSNKFLGKTGIGCMSTSASVKQKDIAFAKEFCKRFQIELEIIETREIDDENYLSNPANRCYFCKTHLYTDLGTMASKYPSYTLLNGTNKDDLGDYRPGLIAASEHEIRSPLVECGMNKQDVRDLAKYLGLPNWDKPASPCLSSRVPYGNRITEQKLRQIEAAEGILNAHGFEEVRVRHFGKEARIEVPEAYLLHLKAVFGPIESSIKDLGFDLCTIDQEGFVSGKLNRSLNS